MRRVLLAATALAAVCVAPRVHAQGIPVMDVSTELNTTLAFGQDVIQVAHSAQQIEQAATQIQQLYTTIGAIIHGNAYAVGALAPELAGLGLVQPVQNFSPELGQMFQGLTLGSGSVGSLAGNILGQTQIYAPAGQDFRAQQIMSHAVSAATQLAAAQTFYDGTQARLNAYPQLGTAIGNSADIKDSMDANSRLVHEQMVAQAHTNQLATLVMMQAAQKEIRAAQEEQAWRCSADQFVANSDAAAAAAVGGAVTLVSSGGGALACQTARAGGAVGLGAGGAGAPSGGSGDPTAGSSGGVVDATYGTTSGTDPTATMMAQPWGSQVAANATAMGVNPTTLAGVCSIESNCQNVAGTGTVSGPFQMTNGTYNQDIAQAAQQDPGLADQIGGKSDPTTEGIAAAQELKNDAAALQVNDIANPTGLDVRGEYQFGPKYGAVIATADDSAIMATVLSGTSASTLAANGITSGETVGQWRAGVASKLGTAAYQPVLLNQAT